MNIRAFSLIALCAALACISNLAAADRVARAYDINNVTEVVVGGASHVMLIQGNSDTLRVEGTPEVMERVKVDQEGQRLTLTIKNKTNNSGDFFSLLKKNRATYYLQLKNLNSLKLHGASSGELGNWVGKSLALHAGGASELEVGSLKLDDFQVELDGASSMTLKELAAGTSRFRLSGASNAKAAGQSRTLKVDANGASDYHGKALKAAQAELQASGASDIDVNVTDQLKAEASGASDIRYLGDPKLQVNTSGASDIEAIN